jgi:hypothetical protein
MNRPNPDSYKAFGVKVKMRKNTAYFPVFTLYKNDP